jgi:hypothetical protein
MSPLTPQQAAQLVESRRRAHRAMGQGRRWYLRGVLMFIVACLAGYRGGQLNSVVAIVMVILAGMCISLGRTMRRSAKASEEKIDLMEHMTSEQLGELEG